MNLPQIEGRQAIEPRHPSRSLPTRRHYSMRSLFLAGVLLAASWVLVGGAAEQSPAPGVAADQLGGLQYRFIGPPGNRLSAVIGVPGDPNTYYVGGASGGVWKSTDGGTGWFPVADGMTAQAIGSLAIAPSDHNVVWAGTGETFIRSNVVPGDGIYKTTDAGKTWTHMGLEKTGRIGRVVIDPRDPDVVFACALGHGYGPQQERGVFKTTDGGVSWRRVLFVDENTGCSDLAMDPTNPRILFVGTWTIDIKTWGRKSGGPGSGVFRSKDGGETWERLSRGLPESPLGKIAVGVGTTDPRRVYALIETGERGSLWRSDDGGDSWRIVNYSRLLNERPHYYTRMLVMPDNENEVYFPSNGMSVTYDGGETSESLRWGGDNHDMWADPLIPDRMMIGNDLGVMITGTRGRGGWTWMRLPVAQVYHVATDNRVPYWVYGHMQDYSSLRGPSNSLGEGIHPSLWTTTAGCETGWNIPDPVDHDIVWGGCYAGAIERFDLKTNHARTVSPWPERSMGAPAGELKYRINWTFPIAISPHDHNTVYMGSQYVLATSDGGVSWREISPDLTLNDPSKLGDSGGLTLDNLSVEYFSVVFSIAESPKEPGVIWAGTNDGLVQVTRDAGKTWTNVTKNMPDLAPYGTVSSVEPSRYADGAAYVAVDFHQVGGFDPALYKTTDYGRTWTKIVNGIPRGPLSYTHVLREDPARQGMLYAGTANGVYVSFNDGASWMPLQANLPHAPVHWLEVQPHFNDLVVGTYGRGIWIMDDVTPLQQITPAIAAKPAHLFAPRLAYRFRTQNRRDLAAEGPASGEDPEYGATINYWLSGSPKDVAVTVLGSQGKTVRELHAGRDAGLNRVNWDLRYAPTRDVQLRTTPPTNPHVWEEKRFRGSDTRPILYYGINATKQGPLVLPGTYTVKLVVDGREETRTVEVLRDPNTTGTAEDIRRQHDLLYEIYNEVNAVVDMINDIEVWRKQIEDLRTYLGADTQRATVVSQAAEVDQELLAVRDTLMQRTLEDGDAKSFRGPIQLYLKLMWLAAEIGTGAGDISGGVDFAPTQPEMAVHDVLKARLDETRRNYDRLKTQVLPEFNKRLMEQGVGAIAIRQ
jgi:photosystem II stability/assembly factor-like uncharacterized protein